MKKILVTLIALGFASSAYAQAATDFATVDADASADITLVEAQALWPNMTEDVFAVADLDRNGSLSEAEFAAFLAANPVPTP